jgi:hypothetical protein
VNYNEKQLTEKTIFALFLLSAQVSYGFPIIHFCNPGVHYETPCISSEKPEVSILASARDTSVVAVIMLWFGSIAGRSQRSHLLYGVQTGSEAHPASFQCIPGIGKPRREAEYSLQSNTGLNL